MDNFWSELEDQVLRYTLDTNCLIDIEDDRPAAIHIKRILRAAKDGSVDVAMVASSASERQKDNTFLTNFQHFEQRRKSLGFGHLPLLYPLLRWDIGFWENALWSSDTAAARENLIYQILFPNSPIEWPDYAAQKAVQSDDVNSRAYRRWRNQILDAQAYWAHDFNDRDVFVTSDRRFRKLEESPHFPKARILEPYQGVHLT